jgi:hypothetical protein
MLAAVTAINKQVRELAPVLNSPTAKGALKVESSNPAVPVATMVKKHGGATCVFAVSMKPGATEAAFTLEGLPAGAQVDTASGRWPVGDGDARPDNARPRTPGPVAGMVAVAGMVVVAGVVVSGSDQDGADGVRGGVTYIIHTIHTILTIRNPLSSNSSLRNISSAPRNRSNSITGIFARIPKTTIRT